MADQGTGDSASSQNNSSNNQVVQSENGDPAQNGQAGQAAQAPQQQQTGWAMVKGLIFRALIIYFITSLFRGRQTPPATTTPGDGKAGVPQRGPSSNLFSKNMMMDMYVYISEQEKFKDFDNKEALFWLEEDLQYGDWTSGEFGDGTAVRNGKIVATENLQNNGSIWMHVYFVKSGNSPNPKDKESFSRKLTAYKKKQLNRYKKRHYHRASNLLTGTSDVHPDLIMKENGSAVEILSHWHPNLTINLLDDHTPWTKGAVPAPLDDHVEFLPGSQHYYPVIYFNDYWNLNSEYMPINDTVKTVNISITYQPISLLRWQLYAAQGMRNKWYSSVLGDDFIQESDEDQDSLKRTFLETSPYLLALTIVISIVHSVFEFLAFKNDIQFWRNRKSLEGLSVRSVFFNVFQSLIVLLYVLDNETNTVIKISVFVGLLIEIWKIHKVVDVKMDSEHRILGIIPRIGFTDKQTYTESETKKYDQMAFKYLGFVLFPLLGGYAVYSIIYLEHKGWYSWVLSLLYGFLLTFGFIMMTPQLFINYKLKSVAHLPWRMLTYKALNTFIDDIFAFVIKMPTLYRIGCFRDDVVFFIFLYQRYIYRVDPKRVNEFGTSADMFDENGKLIMNGEADSIADGTAPAIEGAEQQEPKSAEEKKKD